MLTIEVFISNHNIVVAKKQKYKLCMWIIVEEAGKEVPIPWLQ